MIASKPWQCSHCNGTINPGDEFRIQFGEFFHEGCFHETKGIIEARLSERPDYESTTEDSFDQAIIRDEQLSFLGVMI